MIKYFLSFIFLLQFNIAQATMFIPLSFEKQIQEASSAAEVTLSSSKVFKSDTGIIMTDYSFDIIESYNLLDDDLVDQKLHITMVGGTYDGITSMIDGAPQFKKDDKNFLFLKKVDSKLYISNFTLGKYTVQEIDGKEFFVSDVFPTNPMMGKIAKEKLVEMLKSKWQISQSLSPQPKISTVIKTEETTADPGVKLLFESREPAEEKSQVRSTPFFLWSSLIILIFFFALIFIKLGQSEQQHKSE